MKMRLCLFGIVLALTVRSYAQKGRHVLTPAELDAVIQAVEDEIYDESDYDDFNQIGDNLGTSKHWKSRLHIYINPRYGEEFEGNEGNEGTGQAIYKFMPYGEVVRLFIVRKGQVLLVGDPDNGFPMTQPSHLAVVEDDDEICRLKRIWLKRSFVVDVSPTDQRIAQASRRQKARSDSMK